MYTLNAGMLDFCSVSLPVLEQEELSVCVFFLSALAWAKRNHVGIYWFPIQTLVSEHIYAAVLHYAKHSQAQKILRHLSPLRFLANEENRRIEETGKKLVLMAIFQHIVFQTSVAMPTLNWDMHGYNSSQVTFANSIPFSEYMFFCELIFHEFCYS